MIEDQEPKYCLLIIQRRFHSFEKYIKDALTAKGYTVEVAEDEYPTTLFGKIMGKLQFPLIHRMTYDYMLREHLYKHKYEFALVIRGRGFSKRLVKKMKETVPKIIGYNWDTFNFNQSPLQWFRDVDRYYTFDYVDAEKFSFPTVELFSSLPPDPVKTIKYDITALGKNYPGRLKYIDQVVNILKPKRFYIQLYENNIFDLILNLTKNPRLYLKYLKYIKFRPLSYIDYLHAIKSAEFTIDYANNGQTGITMRCYESVSLKTKIISNNNYLKRSAYFNDTNAVVFHPSDTAEKLILDYTVCKKTPYVAKIRDIDSFVTDLIS